MSSPVPARQPDRHPEKPDPPKDERTPGALADGARQAVETAWRVIGGHLQGVATPLANRQAMRWALMSGPLATRAVPLVMDALAAQHGAAVDLQGALRWLAGAAMALEDGRPTVAERAAGAIVAVLAPELPDTARHVGQLATPARAVARFRDPVIDRAAGRWAATAAWQHLGRTLATIPQAGTGRLSFLQHWSAISSCRTSPAAALLHDLACTPVAPQIRRAAARLAAGVQAADGPGTDAPYEALDLAVASWTASAAYLSQQPGPASTGHDRHGYAAPEPDVVADHDTGPPTRTAPDLI